MRYRALSSSGDYTVGRVFLANSPACVAQAIQTRLGLWLGEWFLDRTQGTPYMTEILAKARNPDAAIKQRILGTQGVDSIDTYTSQYDGQTRKYSVSATVNTIYGKTTVSGAIVLLPQLAKLLTDDGLVLMSDDGVALTISS